MSVVKTLSTLRREHGLKQRDVAETLGVTQSAIAHIESGRSSLSDENRRQLAAYFGCEPADIVDVDKTTADTTPRAYLVLGRTGEHEEREWTVTAYRKEADAQAHVDALNTWCKLRGLGMWDRDKDRVMRDWQAADDAMEHGCPLDAQFYCTYTGTDYRVWSIAILSELPPVISASHIDGTALADID
jgi:transcriptional regulator with XRE-family HTH domain